MHAFTIDIMCAVTIKKKNLYVSVAACPDDYYGSDCRIPCECQNGALCDAVTGKCTCTMGFHGEYCEQQCPVGKFGPGCVHTCNCQNGASCDKVTGCCSCTSGWYGQSCEIGLFTSLSQCCNKYDASCMYMYNTSVYM